MEIKKASKKDEVNSSSSLLKNSVPVKVDDIKIAGIEGGGTHSSMIVMDSAGHELLYIEGPGTNHYSLGIKEVTTRINCMIERAKELLGVAKSHPFDCVGLFLSGCEEESTNLQLVEIFRNEFPNASKNYVIGSDTIGSLKTGLDSGGIVLIAGTGSNARLFNSDGINYTCGGWGHMLGDEGSAYWIAHRACKYVFNDMDNFEKAPYSINYIWSAMQSFFHVTNRNEILSHFYTNFSKSNIGLFTKKLADGCLQNDPLCELLFADSGRALAQHVLALYDQAHNDVKLVDGGIKIICIGAVWKSWDFMKKGFIEEIDKKMINDLTFLRLKVPSAVGACYVAADKLNLDSFVKNYHENTEAFFHYKRNNLSTSGKSIAVIDALCESNYNDKLNAI